ncbi:MAG: pyridoxal-phosphate dependent enzyme [Bacteroidales bacterium]
MARLGLEHALVNPTAYNHSVAHFRRAGIVLPTFAQLADTAQIPPAVTSALGAIDPDAPHPLNLFRVHWFNAADRRSQGDCPVFIEVPPQLTGVRARIVMLVGDRFPMIRAHKVLAAYACLAPRIVTGQFDPTAHRAIWPSTGNYCRGGVAISRILDCRGVAVLPEGMSRERFEWLERWVTEPASDIIRTPGCESNVKEIYDVCAALERDDRNIVFNQFCEFGNYLAHDLCTGRAAERVVRHLERDSPALRLRAFVSATGSAGTIGAGDYLKDTFGARIVAVEAAECPTLLYNGFGDHNIQGIGDKHVPLIHNVMNTDVVVGVSDAATDSLGLLLGHQSGRRYLASRRSVPERFLEDSASLGLSSLCNLLAAVKTAKYFDWGPDDVVVSVATDGAEMYHSERQKALAARFGGRFDDVTAAEVFGQHLLGAATDHVMEMREVERNRVFNLGYYTWVEQQHVALADFEARRRQAFWRDLRAIVPRWDEMIVEFNARTGAASVHA